MKREPELVISGLRVPDRLLRAIREGRWVPPNNANLLAAVFGENPQRPIFLQVNGMLRENEAWHGDEDPETRAWYFGSESTTSPPGDIDQLRSLLIGFLGPDQHIALDYHGSEVDPSVVYLRSDNGWVEVAPNIETLLDLLGLS
jgi:hypothetical protein